MAVSKTITSANSVLALAISDVFPVPQVLEGYAVDDSFSTEQRDTAQTQVGVDGLMSAGYTPNIVKMRIALQANSPSLAFFETWVNSMDAAKEVFYANGSLEIPSIGKLYVLTKGVLVGYPNLPAGKAVLQPVQFELHWQKVSPTNI